MIDDSFLDNLPENPVIAAVKICDAFHRYENNDSNYGQSDDSYYEDCIQFYSILEVFLGSKNIQTDVFEPVILGNGSEDIPAIRTYFQQVSDELAKSVAKITLESNRSKYLMRFGSVFHYEFSEGDLKKVQELVNELRDLIASSNEFEKEHQLRLLKRLEKLQLEMHKKMADLDRFWGLIGDAGVAVGKFGKDAKPIVDRIKDIAGIVWRTQARAEELPSDAALPLLDSFNDSNV